MPSVTQDFTPIVAFCEAIAILPPKQWFFLLPRFGCFTVRQYYPAFTTLTILISSIFFVGEITAIKVVRIAAEIVTIKTAYGGCQSCPQLDVIRRPKKKRCRSSPKTPPTILPVIA